MDGPTTAPEVISGEASTAVTPPLARVPLVLNKRNFDWVTNRISGAVENPTPRWWWVAFAITSAIAALGFDLHRLPNLDRRRRLGIEFAGRLGVGHHQLRFLDRYRSRRHAHFRDPVFAPPEMADLNQSLGRSDDALRGHLRRDFPRHSRRARLDGVVPRPGAERKCDLAELSQPAAVGRLRGLDLFHGLGPLLVHRI